jgi:AP-4 complex subunit mu-1
LEQIIKDYTGVLTEDAIRKNFVLIYEILDEAIDFGYPQMATSDLIKSFVASQPVLLEDLK